MVFHLHGRERGTAQTEGLLHLPPISSATTTKRHLFLLLHTFPLLVDASCVANATTSEDAKRITEQNNLKHLFSLVSKEKFEPEPKMNLEPKWLRMTCVPFLRNVSCCLCDKVLTLFCNMNLTKKSHSICFILYQLSPVLLSW